MSTILMAIAIVAFIIILPWILIVRHKKAIQKQQHNNFRYFSKAGSDRHLSFSRQEIIQNKIIGFDGIQQVLMIVEMDNDYDISCIAVKELRDCKVEKEYYIQGDTAADKEKILKEIKLVFEYSDQRPSSAILFYSNNNDSIYLMADMQAKAVEWQLAISRLINKKLMPV